VKCVGVRECVVIVSEGEVRGGGSERMCRNASKRCSQDR
jgi:hypothetical protein